MLKDVTSTSTALGLIVSAAGAAQVEGVRVREANRVAASPEGLAD